MLNAGERKVPEIMVHQVQEALADRLHVLGRLAVGLETVKESVRKYMQNMHKYKKYAKYAKTKRNMQNTQKHRKHAEYDLHADFAGEELVNSPGVELWVNFVEHRTNNFVPHLVKPSAIEWLACPNEVTAKAAVTLWQGVATLAGNNTPGLPIVCQQVQRHFPFGIRWNFNHRGRAPSARRMCSIAYCGFTS